MAFLDAELHKGIDIVIRYTELKKHMEGIDFVFTGEGSIDSQTRYGKTPYGVAKVAKEFGIPVISISGIVGKDVEILYDYGFDAFFSIINGVCNLDEALLKGKENIEITCENIGRIIKVGLGK